MAAVAVEGCAEPATGMRAARTAAEGAREAPAAVGEACTAFAQRRPALHDAMFTHAAPAALREAFGGLLRAACPIAAEGDDLGLLTETYWVGLHGPVTLMRSARLPAEAHERRLALLIGHFVAGTG